MGRLIGRSRRERLITAGTALAIVIAIVAVIVLVTDGSEGGDSQAYAQQADQLCGKYKRAIAIVAERASRSEGDPAAALAVFGNPAVAIAARWSARLAALDPPRDEQPAAARLELAVAKFGVEARQVAQEAKKGEDLSDLTARLGAAEARVQNAIEAAGLETCVKGQLGVGELETG
jgi:hypothetical protein